MAGLAVSVPDQPGWSGVSASPVHVLWHSTDPELLAALRSAAEGGDLDDVLDTLSRGGVRRTPDFVAVLEGDPLRVVTRGVAYAVGFGPTGPVEFRAGGRGPWDDDDSPQAVERIELRPGAMVGDAGTQPPVPGATVPPPPPAAPPPAATPPVESPPAASPPAAPSPPVAAWRAPAVFDRERLQPPVAGPPAPPVPVAPEPPTAAAPEPPVPAGPALTSAQPAAEVEDLPSYDHLFGATEHVRPQPRMIDPHDTQGLAEPAIGHTHHESAGGYVPKELGGGGLTLPPPSDTERPPTPGPSASATPRPPTPPTSRTPPAPGAPGPGPGQPTPAGKGALIDSVPWRSGGSNVPPAPPERQEQPPSRIPEPPPLLVDEPEPDEPGPEEDEAEATVDRSALLAAQGGPAQTGPLVLAVLCPAGHTSPPHAGSCRVCARPIPPQQPFQTPRPPLGTLRLSTGDVVTLDRGVLLGRSPKLNADLPAGERPHLVRVPSPENDISRNHVEVVLEGWHVLVRDLGSTNGTTVALPGQPPVRLRPSDGQVVEPGTVVTLADEVTLTYEVSPS